MRWISVDPGKRSGVAHWRGDQLVATSIVRPIGTKGLWVVETGTAKSDKISERQAWGLPFVGSPELVVVEDPYGPSKAAVASLAERRGYIRAIAEGFGARVELINTSTWRRCAKEAWGVSWASARQEERIKALSISLVREHYGREVSGDEAEAVLVGHAALRTRIVDLSGVDLRRVG